MHYAEKDADLLLTSCRNVLRSKSSLKIYKMTQSKLGYVILCNGRDGYRQICHHGIILASNNWTAFRLWTEIRYVRKVCFRHFAFFPFCTEIPYSTFAGLPPLLKDLRRCDLYAKIATRFVWTLLGAGNSAKVIFIQPVWVKTIINSLITYQSSW